jgi:hypothetical protein
VHTFEISSVNERNGDISPVEENIMPPGSTIRWLDAPWAGGILPAHPETKPSHQRNSAHSSQSKASPPRKIRDPHLTKNLRPHPAESATHTTREDVSVIRREFKLAFR